MTRRRTVLTTASIVAVLAAGSTTATLSTSAYADANCAEDLSVTAHLGGAGAAPEQTAAAFTKAVAQKPQQIAVDVRLTSDGVPVLLSDDNLERVTNVAEVFPDRRKDPVGTFTLKELRSLDAGSWFGEDFAGQRIATLHEVLTYAFANKIKLSIDPKDVTTTEGLGASIIDEFRSDARWQEMLTAGDIEFGSDSVKALQLMAKLEPEATTMWSPAQLPNTGALREYADWLDVIGQDYRNFAPSDAVTIHQADMKAALYGVDSPSAVTQALGAGANQIITDFPDLMNKICANENPLSDSNGITIDKVVPAVDGSDVQPGTGEYVTLTNTGKKTVDVSGYQIRNSKGARLDVADGYELAPGGRLRVFTGDGIDAEDRYYNGARVNTINNDGDTLTVHTADGVLVAMYSY